MQSSDEKYTPAGVLRFQPALALFSYPFFFSVAWTLIFFLSWHKKSNITSEQIKLLKVIVALPQVA